MFGVVDKGLKVAGELEFETLEPATVVESIAVWLIEELKLVDVLIDLICCC